MSISAIDGTCAFLCRSVGAGRYWKAEGSDPCGVGWVVLGYCRVAGTSLPRYRL